MANRKIHRVDRSVGLTHALRAVLLLSLCALCLPAAMAAEAIGAQLEIRKNGWGRTDVEVLDRVLHSVSAEFARRLPGRQLPAVIVEPGTSGPLVLFARGPGGEYVVQLSARNGHWYQFVYQFAHEMCHVYSNFDRGRGADGMRHRAHQWFEESLCEAAALDTLRRLSANWSGTEDPYLQSAAPTLQIYAQRFISESHRRLPEGQTLAAWYADHRESLRKDPYQRNKDELVANQLLQIFERSPDHWQAIAYLNLDAEDASRPFEDFLRAWCEACPESARGAVLEIMAAFGMQPRPDPAAT